MSTAIYNGYRLPAGMDLAGLLVWAQSVRPGLVDLATDVLHQAVLHRAISLFDIDTALAHGMALSHQDRVLGNCLDRARASVCQEVLDARASGRRCHLEPKATASIIPDGRDLYALFYAEMPALETHWSALPGMSRYGYWNHTEGPADVPAEQWNARGAHWDRLLGPTGRPADVSVELTLVPESLIDRVDMPHGNEPVHLCSGPQDLATRAHQLALETPAGDPPPELRAQWEASGSLSGWVAYDRRLREGAVPAFNAQVASIGQLLVPAPTIAQLRWIAPASPKPPRRSPGS